jgi:ParB-like chromosome segregation protein Spo0J
MFEDLKMTLEYWPIEKLIPYARNPRKNDHAVEKAASWIREFGFRVPILAKSDGTIVDGHLRLKAAKKLGITQIPVSLADDMTEVQIKAFRLSVNKMSELADWDDDLLKLELEELDNLQYDIDSLGFDDIKFDKDIEDELENNNYTKKIKSPIYEPKGDKPEVKELFDNQKTNELIEEIDKQDLPEEIKIFLKKAAERHTVFSYEKIAEYYCHANKNIQDLMEKSALIIIDFNKAIENGFVKLADELAEAYSNDKQ